MAAKIIRLWARRSLHDDELETQRARGGQRCRSQENFWIRSALR
jgi:hypothetical protein